MLLKTAACLVLAGAAARSAGAQTVITYSDEAIFLAALDEPYTRQTFDELESGTILTTQVSGVAISSPNSLYVGYAPITVTSSTSTSTPPHDLFGGFIPGSLTLDQIIVFNFDPPIVAFGFQLEAQLPSASPVTVRFDFGDEDSTSYEVANRNESETQAEFFGILLDRPALRVTLTSGRDDFGTGGFEEFAVDDLIFKPLADTLPPVCRSSPSEGGIDGSATDDREGDTGIASVELDEGAVNLALYIDEFGEGTPSVTFRVEPDNPELLGDGDATGTVVVTDLAGFRCTVDATFHALPGGTLTNETLCSGGGIEFLVSNPDTTDGTSTCSADLPTPAEPALPPGYEPSPADDPAPCTVLTIDSPINGPTEMIYKKAGDYDPRLRLLFSHYDTANQLFPPFVDVTSTVEKIDDIHGDPTRLKGGSSWTPVKVACAIQGTVDCATLPAALNDRDGDGYLLCPAAGSGDPADCNGDILAINPGATEICNGLDDDCDAAVDEMLGTVSCGVGACARTVAACVTGTPQTCVPGAPAAETCNGIDDDCDGVVDDLLFFGGYLPPVNADGSSVFTSRQRTIPFKFRLTNCAGMPVGTATAMIDVVPVALYSAGGVLEEVASSGNANSGNTYRYDASSGQYIYNLSSQSLPHGMVYDVITTIVDDGSRHRVRIAFK
jgi:hypothetical protein